MVVFCCVVSGEWRVGCKGKGIEGRGQGGMYLYFWFDVHGKVPERKEVEADGRER